jgi:hypothetical protein
MHLSRLSPKALANRIQDDVSIDTLLIHNSIILSLITILLYIIVSYPYIYFLPYYLGISTTINSYIFYFPLLAYIEYNSIISTILLYSPPILRIKNKVIID